MVLCAGVGKGIAKKKEVDVLRSDGNVLYLEHGNVYTPVHILQNSLKYPVKMCVFCKLLLDKINFSSKGVIGRRKRMYFGEEGRMEPGSCKGPSGESGHCSKPLLWVPGAAFCSYLNRGSPQRGQV